jgi:hypothetical protein
VLAVEDGEAARATHPWLADHPHLQFAGSIGVGNTVYVATDRLRVDGRELGVAGGGLFPRWHAGLQLSAPGASPSVWNLPGWVLPATGGPTLSYHLEPGRWSRKEDGQVQLRSVAKGQEFVLDTADEASAFAWLNTLLTGGGP